MSKRASYISGSSTVPRKGGANGKQREQAELTQLLDSTCCKALLPINELIPKLNFEHQSVPVESVLRFVAHSISSVLAPLLCRVKFCTIQVQRDSRVANTGSFQAGAFERALGTHTNTLLLLALAHWHKNTWNTTHYAHRK